MRASFIKPFLIPEKKNIKGVRMYVSTFRITRTGNTAAETVNYRTVSLSALEGKNFTAQSGTLSFAEGETIKYVTVNEAAVNTIVQPYYYHWMR